MAQSPAHRFGQMIGNVLEDAIRPLLVQFARVHGLFLDQKGHRPCRKGLKCTWIDANVNAHDLDFVLERGGTAETIGVPVAFIETAWRRYTKHSRNKVQEIQGAIEPLAETHRAMRPFKGAVLSGVFTAASLDQLRSLGFSVVYVPLEAVVRVFAKFGIDAEYHESTPDADYQAKIDALLALTPARRKRLTAAIAKSHERELTSFLAALEATVLRRIERIIVLVLHGQSYEAATVDDAIHFVDRYSNGASAHPVERYEIQIRYTNGDTITGSFQDKPSTLAFLAGYRPSAGETK